MDRFEALWQNDSEALQWSCLFVTPAWLKPVVTQLGAPGEPLILAVFSGSSCLGVMALARIGRKAVFLGTPDVCDYQDMVCAPGREADVLRAVIAYLHQNGIDCIELETIRPDAAILQALTTVKAQDDVAVTQVKSDVSYEMPLSHSWGSYLKALSGKQRHEVRRKMRRLENAGSFSFQRAMHGPNLENDIEAFIALFRMNRADKAAFMNASMTRYFTELMQAMASEGLLRLYFLAHNHTRTAAVLCFDYKGTRHLYNSAYDAQFNGLSVGVLSKLFSIRSAIRDGLGTYDFLKGDEGYKRRIGGQAVQLVRCTIA